MKICNLFSLSAMLCLSLLFSCAPEIEPLPPPPNEQISSSSADQSSSNTVLEYSYCVFDVEKICLFGKTTICPPGGILSNECPYGSSTNAFSSSSAISIVSSSSFSPSSSSILPSSSSALESSSSTISIVSSSSFSPSSSSILPSSSSLVPSSSSVILSSSSTTPSSSSLAPSSNSGGNHLITCVDQKGCDKGIWLAIKNNECIDVEITWTNEYYPANIKIRCILDLQGSPRTSLSIKVGNKPTVTMSGTNTIVSDVTLIPQIQVGKTEIQDICVSFTSDQTLNSVNCKLQF
jgi:hypothetical protein